MIDDKNLSPMMQKYLQTKEMYKDSLLFYRLGDFYELFFEDAKIASKILDIALTGRSCGLEERAPMCGVPYHAVDSYVSKLLEKGYSVAICDQLSEPVPGKIVERDVTRVITPGTVIEGDILEEGSSNYILSLCEIENKLGAAYCDVSTGEFRVLQIEDNLAQNLFDLLSRLRPAEILCNEKVYERSLEKEIKSLDFLPPFKKQFDFDFDEGEGENLIKKQFKIKSFAGHDFGKLKLAIRASGALINYLLATQKRSLNHINKIVTENEKDYMILDYNACRNLELIENVRDKKKKGSLLGHLNKTKTPMGARLLERWILQPLQKSKEIDSRLNSVEELFYNPMVQNEIISHLSNINDIARVVSKISYGTVLPKELNSLKNSLKSVLDLCDDVVSLKGERFANLFKEKENIKTLCDLLDKAIVDNPPQVTSSGGYIKESYNSQLYELRHISSEAKTWLNNLEEKEREETGIKNLRIGYSRVFGYYIEINKSQEGSVPYRYQRKQTISNHERFITDELKEIESKLLNAEDLSIKLENEIYLNLKETLKEGVVFLQETANDVAFLDVICALSKVAQDYNYVRPKVSEKYKHIKIEDGRHPIVEANLKNEAFVPNDAYLSESDDRTLIITGPNMAGKSTYMRQIALIVLMAHIGSFVPASNAEICIVDRIFTRIGASDDLNNGQSTFMVEMVEVANILNNATKNSLVLLDEVGRGTATFDGMSIAYAVLEYISQKIKCKTLFSTHYHEITSLEGKLEGVKNYKITVKEFNDSIIFLRKIMRGSANKSFGIEVAALSGIYEEIINRAKSILSQLEKNSVKFDIKKESNEGLSLVEKNNIINEIRNLDVNKLSPMEAFDILVELNKRIIG